MHFAFDRTYAFIWWGASTNGFDSVHGNVERLIGVADVACQIVEVEKVGLHVRGGTASLWGLV